MATNQITDPGRKTPVRAGRASNTSRQTRLHQPNRLDGYIRAILGRKRWIHVLITAAVILAAVLLITALTVFLGQKIGYLDKMVNAARAFLLLLPIFLVVVLLVLPWMELRRNRGIELIEGRAENFDGRIETYVELRDGYNNRSPAPATRRVVTLSLIHI